MFSRVKRHALRHALPHLALPPGLSFHIRQQRLESRDNGQGITMKRLVIAALLASACVGVARAQDVATIRVGWTIPAEESKYWMMRRPEKFPNLGKGYKIEWSQFQGTSPMSQALIAGALDCATQGVLPIARSEERRVGKECLTQCRSRWSPYH